MRVVNRQGMRFGRLIVLERAGSDKNGQALWACRCNCGVVKIVSGADLRSGNTKSCGCLALDICKHRVRTTAERQKLSEALRGPKSRFWKGGITPKHQAIRNSTAYKNWRTSVFARDNYKCQECGAGGHLNAHHIKAFSAFPDLIFEISNGVTLCVPCHKKTPGYAAHKGVNATSQN